MPTTCLHSLPQSLRLDRLGFDHEEGEVVCRRVLEIKTSQVYSIYVLLIVYVFYGILIYGRLSQCLYTIIYLDSFFSDTRLHQTLPKDQLHSELCLELSIGPPPYNYLRTGFSYVSKERKSRFSIMSFR